MLSVVCCGPQLICTSRSYRQIYIDRQIGTELLRIELVASAVSASNTANIISS